MDRINLQSASEFEISELPITRYDIEDIIHVKKNCHFGKIHKHFKEKWVKWEKKGLVSFGSKDQDTFDLDHENERGEGLDVKLSSLSAELKLERERERETNESRT